jgi:hypothetical protein
MSDPENSPPDPVSQGIIELVDATFDRVAPYIDRYATDERRQTKDGAVILEPHQSVIYDAEGKYGFLALRACNVGSFSAMADLFQGSPITEQAIGMSVAEDSARAHVDRLKIVTRTLAPTILRDYYPQGDAGYRNYKGGMLGRKDYDPHVWGLRHRAGIELRIGLENDQDETFHWKHEFSVQHRFDRDPPQFETTVTRETPAAGQNRRSDSEHAWETQKVPRDATPEDIEFFKALFAATKDLRPGVMPIRPYMKNKKLMARIWQGSSDENLAA